MGKLVLKFKHKVMCGDSTNAEDVAKLLGDAVADIALTDPPYGVKAVKKGMVGADFGVAKKGKYEDVIGDETTKTALAAIALCQSLKIPVQIFWGGNYYQLPPSSCWLVWDKRCDSGIKNTFADCELAWTNLTKPARIYRQLWNGMIRSGEHEKRVHPTQKPVALAEWCMTEYGNHGENVLDLFLGSGSTLMAAERTGRVCYGMELSAAYVDVIIKRWENYTGQKAQRA